MASHTGDQLRYRRNLSQPMSELLADPFSELTRKRQPALLIAATIALLLSAGLASVTEVGVSSFKFRLELPQLATWLAFSVTVYLLAAYLLGVWADWTIAKAKRWSPLASISDGEAAMASDTDDRLRGGERRREKIERLKDELRQINKEIDERSNELSARERQVEIALSSLPEAGSATFEENEQRLALSQESAQIVRSRSDASRERADRTAPIIDTLIDSLANSSLAPAAAMWKERLDLTTTLRTFSRLTILRLILEILFPAAYAVFALVWTVLHM